MTGRDLIIYILSNKLESEPVFQDGSFMGFIPAYTAAAKMEVGIGTILVWIAQGRLDYFQFGDVYFVPADCKLKYQRERSEIDE